MFRQFAQYLRYLLCPLSAIGFILAAN